MLRWFITCCASVWLSGALATGTPTYEHQLPTVDDHPMHLVHWPGPKDSTQPPVLLLSGPVDTWHSDSAWFANLAPRLAQSRQVLAVDRAGMMTQNPDAPVGYAHAAVDVIKLLQARNIDVVDIVAFASSNLTVMGLLQRPEGPVDIRQVIMIDPDVLTPFSIARYKSDAQPFKDNLAEYLAYIGDGKYIPRSTQKNAADREVLTTLAGDDPWMDWTLVDTVFEARLNPVQQANTFLEIAGYGSDLDAVKAVTWPASIPLTIVDTDFEQHYIDNTDDAEAREGLEQWRADAKAYYQELVAASDKGRYVPVDSHAHLYQVEYPQQVVDLLTE
ncbi:alpha/beta fold hydrolase [Aestuariibacter halophilus]|uniref:Alpha/beta fold hydrolase n=1 Tax=Fluctibacter halophilus TaxID=226011 RepID=A0ABS8GDH8_9ALTE|nr:alpha/beta fold hydrolase [Aestuariibacter halophilus]MCC2618311.1 alpha/beta fold hydrolase [Aestuariibacter halophilus]